MPQVLIIEPDRELADAIGKYFVNDGLAIQVAYTAQEAVANADSVKPDIVVLEIAMPKNNGVAFLQEFRTYSDWNEVPIIIYSRIPIGDTALNAEDWSKHGVVAYFYKPVKTLANLLASVKNNL